MDFYEGLNRLASKRSRAQQGRGRDRAAVPQAPLRSHISEFTNSDAKEKTATLFQLHFKGTLFF